MATPKVQKVPRPKKLPGNSEKIKTSCGNLYVMVNLHEGEPFEIFASLGKAGGCLKCMLEALARCISTGLQHGIPVEEYAQHLKGIQCPTPFMFPAEERVLSCPDAIGRVLEKYCAPQAEAA